MAENEEQRNGGLRPIPDPTILTTQLIDRAIQAAREYADGKDQVLTERISGLDRVVELQLKSNEAYFQTLSNERFRQFDTQFKERDLRSERESRDNKVAIDAALAAQKEASAKQDESNQKAIDKSEKATQDTIIKLEQLFATQNRAIGDGISDMKERVGRLETSTSTIREARTDYRAARTDDRGLVFGVLGVLIGASGLVGAVVSLMTR